MCSVKQHPQPSEADTVTSFNSVVFITPERFKQFSTEPAQVQLSLIFLIFFILSDPLFADSIPEVTYADRWVRDSWWWSCCLISRLTSWLYYIALKERKSLWWTFIEQFPPETLHKHPRLSKSTFSTAKQPCPNSLLYYSVFIVYVMQVEFIFFFFRVTLITTNHSKPACDCVFFYCWLHSSCIIINYYWLDH